MSNWTDEVTEAEWAEWTKHAKKVALTNEKKPTSLGFEDYAMQAIEKLLVQEKRPDNVKAWLTRVVGNGYIDRFRKIQARGGESKRALTDEEWEIEMLSHAIGSPSAKIILKDNVDEFIAMLSTKERELLILSAGGFSNNDIAMHLGYASGKSVATRIAQICTKIREKAGIQN